MKTFKGIYGISHIAQCRVLNVKVGNGLVMKWRNQKEIPIPKTEKGIN